MTDSGQDIRQDYTPHARAERLIATGRFILAFCSLAAVYFEPSTPARYQQVTYGLLLVYAIYALVTAAVAWRARVPSVRWRLLSHGLDLVLFTVFVYLTEGPASPFFLYFVFALFCATVRFSWRGILATGAAAIVIYGTMAAFAFYRDPDFELGRAVIRMTYLAVLAALLVYLGIYQQQLRSELASLAAWPREPAARLDDVLRLTLAHAASVLRATRLLLVWEETEEPWVYVAAWSGDAVRVERAPPGRYDAPDALSSTSAFAPPNGASMIVYDPLRSSVREVAGDPVGPALRGAYDIHGAIVVSLHSETLSGRLLVPGVRGATADELALAHIAGRLVLATLEQFFFLQQVRQTASAEERLRISRELHDGIVQSLAGVGLRLQNLRRRLSADDEMSTELARVQRVLERDQGELRTIVRELRPRDERDGAGIVAEGLQRMSERFPLEWGLDVHVDVGQPLPLSARIAHEVCRIVNESLSNAARHGGASRASVRVMPGAGSVDITVADNGKGFAFAGRHDLAALERSGRGPRSLKERVRSLRGSLLVDSGVRGATIEVSIPIGEES